MHICTVASSGYLPVVGGAELGVHSVLRHLASRGEHRMSVINATNAAELPRHEMIDGVEIHRYPTPPLWLRGHVPAVAALARLGSILERLQPDLLHVSYILPGGLAAVRWARCRRIPYVLALGGSDIYDPIRPTPRSLQWLAARAIARAPSILAWSQFTAERLRKDFGARPEALQVVPFGVDTHRFHPGVDGKAIRERHGIAPDETLVFSIQRLVGRKGVDVLLRALARARHEQPGMRALIAGCGPQEEALRALARDLDLADRVELIGYVEEEEKPAYYAAADLFAFHSYYEGLGIVLEEASASGLPVVTTRAGGTTDVVIPGETGVLVDAGDPTAFANALLPLLRDPDRRARMGSAGARRMARDFSEDAVADAYLRTFERAVDEQGPQA